MLIPRSLGAWLHRTLPRSLVLRLHDLYTPYHHWAITRRSRRLLPKVFPKPPLKVLSGPFRDMEYLPESAGSALLPKLLGSYEMELYPSLERLFSRSYRWVVDIGCAEGYYVVGSALRLPGATVHGFDLNPRCLARCQAMAELNKVSSRVRLSGRAEIPMLEPLVVEGTLLISDCEGAERELLDPQKLPRLAEVDMVVELHEWLVPGVTEELRRRFCKTHDIQVVASQDRDPAEFEALRGLSPEDQAFALEEFRGGRMEWLVLTALQRRES